MRIGADNAPRIAALKSRYATGASLSKRDGDFHQTALRQLIAEAYWRPAERFR